MKKYDDDAPSIKPPPRNNKLRNDVYEEHKLDGDHPKSEVTSLTGSTTTNDTVTMISGMSYLRS